MFNTIIVDRKKRNKAFDHMIIKRHQKKKKRHVKDVVVKNMCINEKRKRTFTWWKPFYVHALFCSCRINISTPFPIINYCSSIVNCFRCYPEVITLIKFQNLYTPTNHSNYRNFNEDDRKKSKIQQQKMSIGILKYCDANQIPAPRLYKTIWH